MAKAQVITSDPAEKLALVSGAVNVLVRSAASGGAFSPVDYVVTAGFPGPPPHVHRQLHHVFYILSGSLTFMLDDETVTAAAGTTVHIPAGVAHTFSNLADEDARILEFDAPGGLDGYFDDLAAAFPPGTPVDPAVVAGIQNRYDTHPPTA